MTTETASRILVGLDGSESSQRALQWATKLALQQGGSVTALMAWNYPAALMVPVVGGPVVPADYMSGSTRAKLDALVAATTDNDLIIDEQIVMGAARLVLTEASADHDILVLGRTGNNRLKRLLLGSTAAYCVRHAECPVVIVGESVVPETEITVAVDGSPSSLNALAWALTLGDGKVTAAYSHDEWELDEFPLDEEFRLGLDSRADEMLAEAVAAASEKLGVDESRVTQRVLQGDPRTTLVTQADPGSLLVLGAQGHSGIARWMLGSLADYAVHHAPGTVAIWR